MARLWRSYYAETVTVQGRMDTILVPLDGSPFGEHALGPALGVARRTQATIHLVLVHEPVMVPVMARPSAVMIDPLPALPVPDPHLDEEVRAHQAAYLGSAAQRLAGRTELPVAPALLDGPVAETLVEYAREIDASLVVMTTHGRGGASRAWLGSVAEEMVRHAHVPVLLVRPRGTTAEPAPGRVTTSEFQHALVALDGSSFAERVLEPAIAVIGEQARYTLLRVVEPITAIAVASIGEVAAAPSEDWEWHTKHVGDYLESIAGRLRARGLTVQTHAMTHTHAARAILDYADETKIDVIAMATHGRSGLRRLVMGGVADKVLRSADVPVLLHRPPTE